MITKKTNDSEKEKTMTNKKNSKLNYYQIKCWKINSIIFKRTKKNMTLVSLLNSRSLWRRDNLTKKTFNEIMEINSQANKIIKGKTKKNHLKK
jgi:hypothetical protein